MIQVLEMTNVKVTTLTGAVDMDKVHYCERFMELLIDLEVHTVYENRLNIDFAETWEGVIP